MTRPAAICLLVLLAVSLARPARSDEDGAGAPANIDTAAHEFWAFRKLSPPAIPQPLDTSAVRTAVDAFIVERLSDARLRLSPAADRLTLLRRLSYDLVGLPPTPQEMDAFLNDPRSDAYERLVERLLASPHFGERWGRHWLDAAGYSDITGGDNDAGIIKLSEGKWKYRDYVVGAFNTDMPYERFVIEQLAGDELVDWRAAEAFTPRTQELLIATGFLRNAADDTEEKELRTPDIINGVLQRTSEVVANNLLGLTLGCAKCHDHKYEPIPQRDYYGLLAAFTPAFNPEAWLPPSQRALADISPRQKAESERHNAELDRQVGELKSRHAAIHAAHRERIQESKLVAVPEAIRADVKAALQTAADKRTDVQKYLAEKFSPSLDVPSAEIEAAITPSEKTELGDISRRMAELESTRRRWGTIQAAYDAGPAPVTHLLERGNHLTPGDAVEPGFLRVLYTGEATSDPLSASRTHLSPIGATSGRRLALARWITDWQSPSGGLAARVAVNRVWQHLFGRGIVATSENFGISGAEPTHPELLEYLASQFVAGGRRFKPLIQSIVLSNVYRQASTRIDTAAQSAGAAPATTAGGSIATADIDPGNDLLSHMPLRRLEAEIVRDAILATSGQLDRTLGGPSLPLEVKADGSVVIHDKGLPPAASKARRSLYVLARRNYHLSMLNVFDQPAMSTNCPNRDQSAVVLQSLAMLNDEFVLEQAGHFARRVRAMAGDGGQESRVELAFRIALGRGPQPDEIAWSGELLAGHTAEYAAAGLADEVVREKSLTHLCHMLLNSNEFLYIP